ncbi:hypothetical protein RUM43_007743 [Polyplax serrata]|uniref:Uncharacterized protein n=1 Tax=Polyplax serrata TaxID=468196 RepID=A0AAN8P952_POLSC
MTEANSKEFDMAVGTSTVLESGMMEGENFYAPIESANESETVAQSHWSGPKTDTGQLCRSCANSSDYLIPIYEGEGLEHQLEYKIQKHLPIQVSSTDTLPLQLCYQCASTLIAWDSMISSCLEADKKLRAMQEAAEEPKTSEVYEGSQIEGDTEMLDSDDEPLISSKSKISEKSKSTPIKKNILLKAKSKTVPVKTEKTAANSKEGEDKERSECSNQEKSESVIMKKRKFPKEMETISVLSPTGALKSIYRCKLCGHKTNRSNNLKTHLQIHKRVVPYKCEQCGKKYQKRQDGKDHLNDIEIVLEYHNGQSKKLYKCKLCGHMSNRSYNLKKHLKSHESIQDFTCESCGGKCRQSKVKNYHVKEIEVVVMPDRDGKSRKLFQCKICGERFNRITNLRSHITSHKPISILTCKSCGKEYLGEKSLKEHSLNAHGEINATEINFPYKCEYCDQLFTEKATCELHRQTHAGEKPMELEDSELDIFLDCKQKSGRNSKRVSKKTRKECEVV